MASIGESGIISTSTNWIVADGCVGDCISFETSADTDTDTFAPKPLILLEPPPTLDGDDRPPCEITVTFRGKHEIHSVYMRSTARIYEIYYAADHQNTSKEYLCTVRCGAVVREETPPLVTKGANGSQENSEGTAALQEQVVRSDSCSSSDEDGWIQVKVPDSSHQENIKNLLPESTCRLTEFQTMQNHYEATAEISDSSPCFSLTLRLLSIQTKICVRVEEIYIYADRAESISTDPPTTTETSGASSILAMLVPSLLQMSKSRDIRIQERAASDDRGLPNYQGDTNAVRRISLSMENMERQNAYSSCMSPDKKLGSVPEPTEGNTEKIQLESSNKVPELNQMTNSYVDQHMNTGYDRIESLLGELIARVGRVEAFCSRFEENMMTPLSRMETRLQQVECKLDALTARSYDAEQFPHSRVSSPESLHEESDSVNRLSNIACKEAREDSIAHTVSPADGMACSAPEFETRPGLVVKVPDFSIEDDECVDTDSTLDSSKNFPMKDKVMCIDDMLNSSLTAFLTSNTVSPLDTASSLRDIPLSRVDATSRTLNIFNSAVSEDSNVSDAKKKGTCFGEPKLVLNDAPSPGDNFSKSDTKNKECDTLDAAREIIVDVTNRNSNTFDIAVSEDNDCNVSDAKRKGMCFGESKLVLNDAPAPGDNFSKSDIKNSLESDIKNKDCNTLDATREGTNLDDSLFVTNSNVGYPGSIFEFGSGWKVMGQEYPKEGNPCNFDDASHLVERNCLMNGASMSTAMPSLLLAASQLLKVKSPEELPHESSTKRTCEEYAEAKIRSELHLDQSRNILLHKVCSDVIKDDDGKFQYATPNLEACDGGCSEKQRADGLHTPTVTVRRTGGGLRQSVNHKRVCGLRTDENGCEEVVCECPQPIVITNGCSSIASLDGSFVSDASSPNSSRVATIFPRPSDSDSSDGNGEVSVPLSRFISDWIDEYSSDSSVDERFLKDKVEIPCLDKGINYSGREWQAASSNYANLPPFWAVENKTNNHDHFARTMCQSCESYSQVPKAGLEKDLPSSALDFDYLCDLKFAPDNNWITGLPLEILLGEVPDANAHEAAEESRKDNSTTTEQQQQADRNADADTSLLVDLENPPSLCQDDFKALDDLPLFTDFADLI